MLHIQLDSFIQYRKVPKQDLFKATMNLYKSVNDGNDVQTFKKSLVFYGTIEQLQACIINTWNEAHKILTNEYSEQGERFNNPKIVTKKYHSVKVYDSFITFNLIKSKKG